MNPIAKRRLLIPLIAIIIVACFALGPTFDAQKNAGARAGQLTVHFIDVDQGDATLIQGDDVVILIDAGRHDRRDVVPYLRSVGVTSIDLLVGTHPHADHIGQFPDVLRAFPVKEVWLSGDIHTSRTYENAIDAILESDAGYHEPRAGERFQFGSVTIDVIHPNDVNGDFNNGSIGLRLTYGNVAFLFTGDAEQDAERSMIARGHTLQADVLHVGHHGSSTSSSLPFLQAVRPKVAVYSAGVDNSYGHPHREVIARLKDLNVAIYGTDVHGTIRVETDGEQFRVETAKGREGAGPILGGLADEREAGAPVDAVHSVGCGPDQVDVNTSSPEELVKIIYIGETLARELISRRPYATLDELDRIPGIGAARLKAIIDQGVACVGGS